MIVKKILKYSAYSVLGLIILIIGSVSLALFLINTQWGKDKIVSIANEHSPVKIGLEDLSLNVFKGRIELKGIDVFDQEKARMVRIGYFGTGVQYKPMFSGKYIVDSLIVSDIDADVLKEQIEALKSDKPEEEKVEADTVKSELPDIIVSRVAIRNLSAKYKDNSSEYGCSLRLIEAMADVRKTEYSLLLEQLAAHIKTPDLSKTVTDERLSVKLEGQNAFIDETALKTEGMDLTLGGKVTDLFEVPFFDLKFSAAIETEKLLDRTEVFSNDRGSLVIAGSVSGRAEYPEADFTVRHGAGVIYAQNIQKLDIAAVYKKKLLTLDARIDKSAKENFVIDGSVDLTQVFPGGLISSEPDLKKTVYDLVIKADNFSLSNVPGMPDAVFDFGLELKGRGVKPEEITADALINTQISPFSYDRFRLKEKASLVADVNWNKGKFTAVTDIHTGKLSWDAYEISSLSLSGGASDKGSVEIKNLTVMTDSSEISLKGKAKVFKDLKPLKNPEINITFRGSRIRSEKFYPDISTEVNFSGWVKGFADSPIGEFHAYTGPVSYQGVEIDSIGVKAGINRKEVTLEDLSVYGGGGKIGIWGSMKDFQTFKAQINIDNIKADSLYTGIAGKATAVVEAEIRAEGKLDDPSAEGSLKLKNISSGETVLPDTKIDFSYKNKYADLTADPGFIIKAHTDLKTKEYGFSVNFDQWDYSPFLPENSDGHLKGTITGKINGKGSLDNPAQPEIDIPIDSLTLDMDGRRYVSGYGLVTKVKGEKLLLEDLKLNFLDSGFIDVNGFADKNNGIGIKADILLPVKSLAFANEMLLNSEGFIKGGINIDGNTAAPVITGTISPDNIGLYIEETDQKLHGISGEIGISKDKVAVKGIKGMLEKGTFELKGDISMLNNSPEKITLDLSTTALPLNYPDQLEGLLNSKIRFEGTPEKGRLTGELEIVEALYYKNIDLFGGMFKGSGPKVVKSAATDEGSPEISLDLKLKSRRDLVMDNNMGFLELKPDLQIKGDISAPVITGRAVIRKDGFLMFQKRTFTITKGVLDFEPVYGALPTADIQGETAVGKYKIFLSVTENLSNPKFTLTSLPAESDADILSILIFGRKASELSGGGQPVSKEKLIADWLSSAYSGEVAAKTGLDYIEVNVPDDFSASAPAGYGLTVGKKISDRLILKYSLVNDGSDMIQKGIADYQMFENIIFSGFRSTDGNFGAETQFRKEFR